MYISLVLGLERVAEELMGRRRWRQYQAHILGATNLGESATAWEKDHICSVQENGTVGTTLAVEEKAAPLVEDIEELTAPKDWQPEDRCYFCDGAVHTEPSRVSLVNPALCVAHPIIIIILIINILLQLHRFYWTSIMSQLSSWLL